MIKKGLQEKIPEAAFSGVPVEFIFLLN